MPNAFLARARRIQRRLLARFAIDVGTSIDRVGQHMVDGGVARFDPADPHTSHRPHALGQVDRGGKR